MTEQPVDERREQIKADENGRERARTLIVPDVEDIRDEAFQRKSLESHVEEEPVEDELVEFDFQIEFQELRELCLLTAHEVACYQEEAVDSNLTGKTEELQEDHIGIHITEVKEQVDSRIDHIMVGDDQNHQHNPEQLYIR